MKRFGFYKNIILVVASALTLVAVTFAWFSVSYVGNVPAIQASVAGELVKVDFFELNESNEYTALHGDIELKSMDAGSYKSYKLLITTNTADKMRLNLAITDLPTELPADLKNSVCIKYTLRTATKTTAADGTVSYVDGEVISESNGYKPLSELTDGLIFNAISLSNYQSTSADNFVIYYEIGLSEDSPQSIGGLESSLGNVKVSAQRVS